MDWRLPRCRPFYTVWPCRPRLREEVESHPRQSHEQSCSIISISNRVDHIVDLSFNMIEIFFAENNFIVQTKALLSLTPARPWLGGQIRKYLAQFYFTKSNTNSHFRITSFNLQQSWSEVQPNSISLGITNQFSKIPNLWDNVQRMYWTDPIVYALSV